MASLLKLTTAQKQELADTYDAKKMQFEAKLERDLKRFFNQIADDLLILYSATSELLNFEDYLIELEVLLRKAYREVSKFSSEHFERELQKQQDEGGDSTVLAFAILLRKDISKKIFVNVDKKIKTIVPAHASEILKTTRKVIVKEIDKATIQLGQSQVPFDSGDVIDLADTEIRLRNSNRAGTVSETEVGTAFSTGSEAENQEFSIAIEDAKKNEQTLGNLSGEELFELETLKLAKTWISLLDNVTREAHLDAHGQEVDIYKPYVVMNQLLMQPLDSSLGATLDNIINCRCASIAT